MCNELTAFFITIMNDLDGRESMYENRLIKKPECTEKTRIQLALVENIKTLTLNRARQFGITVSDDRKYLEQCHQMGIAVSDYKNPHSQEFEVRQK